MSDHNAARRFVRQNPLLQTLDHCRHVRHLVLSFAITTSFSIAHKLALLRAYKRMRCEGQVSVIKRGTEEGFFKRDGPRSEYECLVRTLKAYVENNAWIRQMHVDDSGRLELTQKPEPDR